MKKIYTVALLLAAALVLAGLGRSAREADAHHLCPSTGSPLGPFNIQTYEAADYRNTYGHAMELAGFNGLFPEYSSFALPPIETGGREAGSSQATTPYVPPVILKAIAWLESSWAQASYDPLVQYGEVGPALISHDCGYGIMQITSGMQNVTGVPNLDQAMIGGHYAFNIARGARILADKWNIAPESRPLVGNRDPHIIENWYYALWGYNGFAFKNHPLNPSYNPARPPFSCGPSDDGLGHDSSQYPYQELVLGCVAHPPLRGGQQLWQPQPVQLPDLSAPEFAGPLSAANWDQCSLSGQCAAMDIPTPNPSHADPTTPGASRSQLLGTPAIAASVKQATIVAGPPSIQGQNTITISNAGSSLLAWRATSSAPWLKVSAYQGIALGNDLGAWTSTLTIFADVNGLGPGVYTGQLVVESLYASAAPLVVPVTLRVSLEGALLTGSGPEIYLISGGLRRHIPNPETFEARGWHWADVLHVADSVINSLPLGDPLPNILADGNLLAGSGPEVYVMQSGARRHVTSPEAFGACSYGWDAISHLPDLRLGQIPLGADLANAPCPRFVPGDGMLLQGSGPAVYVGRLGLKRHVPNPASFEGWGFRWGNIDRFPDSTINAITPGRPLLNVLDNGNLLRGSGPAVYVMQDGARRHVTGPDVMSACGYTFAAVHLVNDSRLQEIPLGADLAGPPCPQVSPPGGALLQGSDAAVYLMKGGLKRHIPDVVTMAAWGMRWGDVDRLADSTMMGIPGGQALLDALADGNLLKGDGPSIYVMDGGLRRHISSPEVMSACGYYFSSVRYVAQVLGISAGPDLNGPPCPRWIPPTGSLLKGTTDAVYIFDGAQKRHVASSTVFGACGYQWGNVNDVTDWVLETLPTGAPVSAQPCP